MARAASVTSTVRIAQGPRTTEQSLAWLAAEAGLFSRLDIRAEFSNFDTDAAALESLLTGGSHLAYAGIAQVARRKLAGDDPVIIATLLAPNKGGFLMASASIPGPGGLAGARVGVLSTTGTSAIAAGAVLERANAKAEFMVLKNFEAIYAALANGKIDAGWLPVDLSIKGRVAFGWNGFEGVRLALPGGYATTRRAIASNRNHVEALVKMLATAVHFFKRERETVIGILQQFVGVEHAVAADLQRFYAGLFRDVPAPSVFFGMAGLRNALSARYPAAERMQAEDLVDGSFVDALVRSGYIAKLMAGAR